MNLKYRNITLSYQENENCFLSQEDSFQTQNIFSDNLIDFNIKIQNELNIENRPPFYNYLSPFLNNKININQESEKLAKVSKAKNHEYQINKYAICTNKKKKNFFIVKHFILQNYYRKRGISEEKKRKIILKENMINFLMII